MTPAAEGWTQRRLTDDPSPGGVSHSYYDLPVFDGTGRLIAAHRLPFTGRHPGVADAVAVGLVDCELDGRENWTPLGESRAWSWQQGPMAQWVAGGSQVVWNDREDGRLVARVHDIETGARRTLPGQVYAVDAAGRVALSIDMMRLDRLRPGYGYPGGDAAPLHPAPGDDGVWAMDMTTGARRLILDLARAVAFLNARCGWRDRLSRRAGRMVYWFNHAKISPDGRRFTVKLRWRRIGGPWDDRQGVSLTCGMDGSGLHLLAPATSHVIWQDDTHLYFWQRDALRLARDTAPEGTPVATLAPDRIVENVHMRHLDAAGTRFVVDTPYRERIEVAIWDRPADRWSVIASFDGHLPKSGPFRCDLHPCPSPDGRRIVVTSLQGGTRQIDLLERA